MNNAQLYSLIDIAAFKQKNDIVHFNPQIGLMIKMTMLRVFTRNREKIPAYSA